MTVMRAVMVAGLAGVAALVAAVPGQAQSNYRVRTLVVYGNDPCPKSTNPDEIVVCRRRPADELYRISPAMRAEDKAKIERRDEVTANRTALASGAQSATGLGSNSTVGPGGAFGRRAVTDVRTVVKNVQEGVSNATDPTDP